jgi:hypothetical protein
VISDPNEPVIMENDPVPERSHPERFTGIEIALIDSSQIEAVLELALFALLLDEDTV